MNAPGTRGKWELLAEVRSAWQLLQLLQLQLNKLVFLRRSVRLGWVSLIFDISVECFPPKANYVFTAF